MIKMKNCAILATITAALSCVAYKEYREFNYADRLATTRIKTKNDPPTSILWRVISEDVGPIYWLDARLEHMHVNPSHMSARSPDDWALIVVIGKRESRCFGLDEGDEMALKVWFDEYVVPPLMFESDGLSVGFTSGGRLVDIESSVSFPRKF